LGRILGNFFTKASGHPVSGRRYQSTQLVQAGFHFVQLFSPSSDRFGKVQKHFFFNFKNSFFMVAKLKQTHLFCEK
jgi:hypothetical protein